MESFEVHKTGLSQKQIRLCHNISLGMPQHEAYRMAGYGTETTDKAAASVAVCKMIQMPRMKAYLQELQESSYLANVLSLAEKRSFLADVVRTGVGQITVHDKLAQRVRYHKGELVEIAMPDKVKALELDSRLAGELRDNAVNVNVGLQSCEREAEKLVLPKDAVGP